MCLLFGAGITAGGVSTLADRTPPPGMKWSTYNLPLGLVLIAAGLGLLWLSYMFWSMGWEIYKEGVVQRRLGKTTVLRFDEVESYSYAQVDGGLKAPDVWVMGFEGRR